MTRRHTSILLGALIAGSGVLGGCPGSEPDVPFLETNWRTRCDVQGGCLPPPLRQISGENGQDDISLSCAARRTGDNLLLTLRGRRNDNAFGIELTNAVFPASGGELVGSACQLAIIDNGNTYEGACGAAEPAADCMLDPETESDADCPQPCRVFNIAVNGTQISGQYYCQGLQLNVDRRRVVEVTDGISGATGTNASAFPASFLIDFCTGL